MRVALVIGLASAACGSKAPASHPAAQQTDGPIAPRATPAPKLAWQGRAFVVDGLPAVARGGEAAVVAVRDNDSARGFPNLRIEVRDRTDKVTKTLAVMTVNEYQQLVPDGQTAGPELVHRLEVVNHELAKLHGIHDLMAMHPLELQTTADAPHLAIGDGLDVDFNVDHLHVFHHNDMRPFITTSVVDWLAKPEPTCANCVPCANPPHLTAAYHAPPTTVLVVEIGYTGTDTCWEPPDQWHVISW